MPSLQEDKILVQVRNFYGVKKIVEKEGIHALISQSTVHGLQTMEGKPNGFSSYYGALQPVIEHLNDQWKSLSVSVIGLGIGTLACQFRQQDTLQLIEIDEQVIHLAQNPQWFTYLHDCPPRMQIVKNDGRLAVEQLADHSQDLLVIDAFNSDAIPVHLLTMEAFSLYKQKISAQGVILVNLSNRHLALLPVLTAAGRALDMMVFYTSFSGNMALGQLSSEWGLLTMNENIAMPLMRRNDWRFVTQNKEFLWTDDYSNLIPLLKW